MKPLKFLFFILSLFFLCNCHSNKQGTVAKASASEEFHKMAWLEGLWTNPDDSVHRFTLWQRKNDTLLSGSSWEVKGRDSIAQELFEISVGNDDILLSNEIYGKNDGNPAEYRMVSNKNGEHVFEASEQEFPQRIIYILKPDGSLYIRKEGTSEGQPKFEERILTKMK